MAENPLLCGVVEGFYGRPWSGAQRRQLFAWMRAWGLNSYLHAPKDDPKHRLLWRQLYSPDEAAELKELIDDCQRNGLQFAYALAPGLDISYSSRADRERLRRKAGQLQSLGCRRFALPFDDIPPALSKRDARTFDTVAGAQSAVTNEFLDFLRLGTPDATLFFCPTHYCERMAGPVRHSRYLKQLGELLDASIHIFWTGPEIVSEIITVESVRALRRVLRRKPLLWDNLHANDYDLRRIYLGPYSGRAPELRDEIAGILSNPNCQFEANYVPLRTLAMFARAQEDWSTQKAYQAALKNWSLQWKTAAGRGISIRELELLGDCFYLPHEHGRRAEEFLANFQWLLDALPGDGGAIGRAFDKTCSEIFGLFEKMAGLKNRDLLFALYRHVWELKEEVVLMREYLDWHRTRQPFTSVERRPKIYRGGLVADLQRLLPMDDEGCFHHQPPGAAPDPSDDSRAL